MSIAELPRVRINNVHWSVTTSSTPNLKIQTQEPRWGGEVQPVRQGGDDIDEVMSSDLEDEQTVDITKEVRCGAPSDSGFF